MQDDIRAAIDKLQTAFQDSEADGTIDEGERAELRELVGRLDELLAAPGDHDGVVTQLEGSALSFESKHPSVATVIRGIVDTLTSYGI